MRFSEKVPAVSGSIVTLPAQNSPKSQVYSFNVFVCEMEGEYITKGGSSMDSFLPWTYLQHTFIQMAIVHNLVNIWDLVRHWKVFGE